MRDLLTFTWGFGVQGAMFMAPKQWPIMTATLERPLGMHDTGFHSVDTNRLAAAYENRGGTLELSDPPKGQWSRPPAFPDGAAGLVSTVDDLVAFGRMLLHGRICRSRTSSSSSSRNVLPTTPACRQCAATCSPLHEPGRDGGL